MLAVVHYLASAGQFVRRRASTQVGTPLEQFDAISRIGERASRREPRQSAADDGDAAAPQIVSTNIHLDRKKPFAITRNFSAALSLTLSENTS